MGRKPETYTLDLFADDTPVHPEGELRAWPDASRFPLNVDAHHVENLLYTDLAESRHPLIVTGFASLDKLINFIAGHDGPETIRILLGHEPFDSRQDTFELHHRQFASEVEHYWLEQGISVLLSAKVIRCIEDLERGRILARYKSGSNHRLHAKIYCGDRAATIGSSNFTHPGLHAQLEANARFTASKDRLRFQELTDIAENYWSLGRDYNQELIELLKKLLNVVNWQEAMARACAELLEGQWASAYLRDRYLPIEKDLWPSQRQGIAQALYIISRQDSILVADATGSGKTRMGVHLVRALLDHNLRSGRLRHGSSLMVCPPTVKDSWENEALYSGTHMSIFSHGVLSHGRSGKHDHTVEALKQAQILCVDEGHNFLNIKSNRSQHLLRNMADNVLLFTATPINRSVTDLLRIVDMLGADNLADSSLDMFKKMLGAKQLTRSLTEEEIEQLRTEINRFTLRRTKRMLNALVKQSPEEYCDARGKQCRYPKHRAEIYHLNESDKDRRMAMQIRELADQLHAVSHFQKPVEMPSVLKNKGVTEEAYLRGRLRSAKTIARYMIMAALRSSRIALVEHILGTRHAIKDFKLTNFSKHSNTGNIIKTLKDISGKPAKNKLSIPLPDWLTEPVLHAEACQKDHDTYMKICALARSISPQRETAKASLLIKLMSAHDLLLAFDTRPITLAVIRNLLHEQKPQLDIIMATGDPNSQRKEILDKFKPGSASKHLIGLCSDSLSEGVNLQQASTLVHLDMPSVVRIAEQRVGRIDRMDSPHKQIEVWWPDDAEEFALSTDERFIERYETVESLLGSNLPLPIEMLTSSKTKLSTKQLIAEYESKMVSEPWDGIYDAFQPVRMLVDGEKPLIEQKIYEHYRHIKTRVMSRVSLVKSRQPWAFFCIAAGAFGAPRWLLLPNSMGSPVEELGDICSQLRHLLGDEVENLEMDARAEQLLEQFLRRLSDSEKLLLSRKKQRALEEMQNVIARYIKDAAARQDQDMLERYQKINDMLVKPNPYYQPDWNEVASRWLDLIRPVWYDKLQQPRSRPLLLADIRPDLYRCEDKMGDKLIAQFRQFPHFPPPDKRIISCIIGVC